MMAAEVADRLRVLLVDDEPLARDSLRHLLSGDSDAQVVGECGGGGAALALIDELSPDLVFLDIQMPDIDGFEVLRRLPRHKRPEIVFVTAFDEHAVQAFEVHALDYLLKPVSRDRFGEAFKHAKEALHKRVLSLDADPSWARLVDTGGAARHLTRLAVRVNGRIRLVQCADIDWIEASDYYSRIHVGSDSHLLRRSMKSLEGALDPARFVRLHRGAIVQIDRVFELRRLKHGGHQVLLRDGTVLRLSRSRRKALRTLVQGGRSAS